MWKNIFALLKRYKYQSILVKTFFIVIGIEIAMMAVVNSIYFYKIEKNIYREIEENCVLEVERQRTILDALVEQIINFSYFTTLPESMAVFGYATVSNATKEKEAERLYSCIKTFQKSFDYIESAYIYLEDQEYVITDSAIVQLGELKDVGWLEDYNQLDNERFYMLSSRLQHNNYPYLLTVYYPVYRVAGVRRGAVVVNIDMDKLRETLGFDYRDLRNVYMVNSDGKILFTNNTKALKNSELIRDQLVDMWSDQKREYPWFMIGDDGDDEFAVVAVKSSYGNWYYWMEVSVEYYGGRFDDVRHFMLWSAVVSILVGLFVSILLALKSYKPVRYAVGLLESDETVVEEILHNETNQNEFRRIFELTHQIPKAGAGNELKSNEWLERLGRAQMHVLQSQITPHFLYNTLESIRWMAVEWTGDQNEVSKSVYSLSQLLRKSLNQTSYFVSLGEEVEHAKLYLQVMEIQDPGKLQITWDVPEELYSCKVVRFTLQPILENAIKHGFRHRRFRGRLEVKAEVVADTLMIRIMDDGCGMTREECIKVNQRLASEYDIVNERVGVQNVNQRIKIMFGEEYGVRLMPGLEEGLMVYLAFPIMES